MTPQYLILNNKMPSMIPVLLLTLFVTALSLRFGSQLERETQLGVGNATDDKFQSMELKSLNGSTVFTSGFLRTDKFDEASRAWIQAEVQPIGVCLREGVKSGSVRINQVTMNDISVLTISNFFDSFDCSGKFLAVPHLQKLVEVTNQLETRISHAYLEQALELIPASPNASANGIIITSYHTSEGCVGTPAHYDLISEACAKRNDALGTFGMFWCDTEEQVLLFAKYGPYVELQNTYPLCEAHFNEEDVTKQPLGCSDQSVKGDGMNTFPVHQTVKCVFGDVTWEEMM